MCVNCGCNDVTIPIGPTGPAGADGSTQAREVYDVIQVAGGGVDLFNGGSGYDLGNYTIPATGKYSFHLNMWAQATSVTQDSYTLTSTWYKNGVIIAQGGNNSFIVNLALNDVFDHTLVFTSCTAGDLIKVRLTADLDTALGKVLTITGFRDIS